MKEALKSTWEKHPLILILAAGLFFRLLAVIFSKGYGMSDDHFLVIEASQSWVDGFDYNDWLPSSGAKSPDGHSMFYSGIHYLVFLFLKWIGMTDPQSKMYIIRALHALWSMLTIIYGYKIAEQLGGVKAAKQAGLILALLFFFPMFSVRNLVEVVCIPPLVIGTWMMIDSKRQDSIRSYIWVGLLFGTAFNIRFQSMFFIAGAGLVFIFQKQWKKLIVFSIASFFAIFSIQGIVDMFVWKRPFAEFFEYVRYNIANSYSYSTGAWYQYLLLFAGILLPPVSLFLLFGFVRSWKKYPMVFWPAFVFIVFHSIFPNKQERFVMPVIPFIIILGCIGWYQYIGVSAYWQKHAKLLKGCWVFFWIINCIALPVVSTTYSKKNRVEAMTVLSHKKDLQGLMIEESYPHGYIMPPLYYVGRWNVHVVGVTADYNLETAYLAYKDVPQKIVHPNYVVFFGKDNIAQRIASFKKMFPHSDSVAIIYPSFLDNVLEWLNPVNKNQTTWIYHFTEEDVHLPDGASANNPSKH